ncbi:MAG: hypothetical protein Q7I98_02375 [Erysipelotrichaceae bacterium]|nr:hypothetical protein [Erysipelotrichaceae bacterium]
MNILKIVMIDSYKAVNCGIFAMNNIMTTDSNNEIDMKTESVDAFRFFIQRRLYG